MTNSAATRTAAAPVRSSTDPFLQQVRLDYGPADIFSRFLLKSLVAAEELGLRLEIGSFHDLVAANDENRANWLPLLTIFDPSKSDVTVESAFCVLGRDAAGRVVAAHAARLFDWSATTFHEEAESLRLFYADPASMRLPGERCIVTAPSALTLTGQVVYSGAAWYHPAFRGLGLSAILPKIAKVLAFARWSPDFICSVMQELIYRRGFADRFDYPVVDWAVEMIDGPVAPSLRVALVSMEGMHAITTASNFLSDAVSSGDAPARRQRRA